MYTWPYLKWITSKDLLCSTGNSAQCYKAAWMGDFVGEWMHVCVWLSPFTVHLKLSQLWSLICYTPIQNKKHEKQNKTKQNQQANRLVPLDAYDKFFLKFNTLCFQSLNLVQGKNNCLSHYFKMWILTVLCELCELEQVKQFYKFSVFSHKLGKLIPALLLILIEFRSWFIYFFNKYFWNSFYVPSIMLGYAKTPNPKILDNSLAGEVTQECLLG